MKKLHKPLLLSACGVFLFAQGQLLAQTPPMEKNFGYGMQFLRANRFRDAAYYLELSLKSNPDNPDTLYTLAVCRQRLGEKDKAMELYKKVIFAVPNKPAGNMAIDAMRALDPAWVQEHVKTVHVENGIVSTRNGMVRSNEGTTMSLGELKEGLNPRGHVRTPRMVPASTTPLPATTSQSSESAVSSDDKLPTESRIRFQAARAEGIMLQAYINNRPLMMKFDTGAPGISIGVEQLRQLGIQPPSGKPDGYTGGSSNNAQIAFWTMPAEVKVENIVRHNIMLKVLESSSSSPLLGQTFFKDFDYTIDQSAGIIDFKLKGREVGANRNAYEVPFEFATHGNRIMVTLEINGRPKKVIFDTGNTACALAFGGMKQLKEVGLDVPADARTERHVGVSGEGTSKVFNVRKVKLGPIERYDVEVSVNDQETGVEAPFLGQPFWQGWQYKIDMQRRVIEFVRRG